MKTVVLDALVPREDFEINEEFGTIDNTRNKTTLSIEDLKYDSFFFSALRKPIFQRETNDWTSEKVFGMVESFVNGDLVPAVILWRSSSGLIFVIDGGHRLSSLSAWINDDYGDGDISRKYFSNDIPDSQIKESNITREKIDTTIGSYKEILSITRNSQNNTEEKKKIAKNLGALAIQLQWVEGDASKAEDSFLKINQSATTINPAELELIKNRDKAFAIAARAIIRAGKGYKYWSSFEEKQQEQILKLSSKIHKLMFNNKFDKDNINTYSLGGNISSAYTLEVVTQTIKICNDIELTNKKQYISEGSYDNVMKVLKNTLIILEHINSKKPFSLGIHPYIYFYAENGKHRVASYYAFLFFSKKMIEEKKLNNLIEARAKFETIIYQYSFIIQQIVRKYRQSKLSYTHLGEFYYKLVEIILENPLLSPEEILDTIKSTDKYSYLKVDIIDSVDVGIRQNFSRSQKQQVKLSVLASNLSMCSICGGYLDTNSISIDHILRKRDGGIADITNAQVTHLYCNTTFKN